MILSLNKFDIYFGLAINGVMTGLGASIGTYFAQAHIIKKSEKLVKKFKRLLKR